MTMPNMETSSVNYSVIINPKVQIYSFDDLILQAYYAGLITKYATLIIYGTGAERGTYGQFANLHMANFPFNESKEALTYFTDIYSTALRNKGKTNKKTNFYLSQRQEITPLLNTFGLQDMFQEEWNNVTTFDKINDLNYECSQNGHIRNWESRTKKVSIPLIDHQLEILENVTENVLSNPSVRKIIEPYTCNPEELIQLTFIEGLRGLLVGDSDIETLKTGQSIISQYAA